MHVDRLVLLAGGSITFSLSEHHGPEGIWTALLLFARCSGLTPNTLQVRIGGHQVQMGDSSACKRSIKAWAKGLWKQSRANRAAAEDADPTCTHVETVSLYVVESESSFWKCEQTLAALNALGRNHALIDACSHGQIQPEALSSDALDTALSFAGIDVFPVTACVSKHWMCVTVRAGLMFQLADAPSVPQTMTEISSYVQMLDTVCGVSQALSAVSADCQAMKCAYKQDDLEFRRTKFQSTVFALADAETIAEATKARSIRNRIFSVGDKERRAGAAAESAAGDHPLSGADGIVNASTEPALLASAIQMFQTYFSYELHHVMPLVVHQQSSIGMDFRNVQTWVKVSDDKLQACVAWRWREGASQECATQRVLEVLFLAAHSKIRRQQIGTSLVNSLIECAAANEAIMYVEVGINDWRSQDFWNSHSFVSCDQHEPCLSQLQLRFFENNCWRFGDTIQFVYDPLNVPPPSCARPGWIKMTGNLRRGLDAEAAHSAEDNPEYLIQGVWHIEGTESMGEFIYQDSSGDLSPCAPASASPEILKWRQTLNGSFSLESNSRCLNTKHGPSKVQPGYKVIDNVLEEGVNFAFLRNNAGGFNVRANGSNRRFGKFMIFGTLQHCNDGGDVVFYKKYV